MANADFQSIRRLLRQAFSEILTISDRVVALEERGADATPPRRPIDLGGVVDLNAGLTYQNAVGEGVAISKGPLLRAKLRFPLPLPNAQCEMTFGSATDHRLELKKVLFRGDWLGNAFVTKQTKRAVVRHSL